MIRCLSWYFNVCMYYKKTNQIGSFCNEFLICILLLGLKSWTDLCCDGFSSSSNESDESNDNEGQSDVSIFFLCYIWVTLLAAQFLVHANRLIVFDIVNLHLLIDFLWCLVISIHSDGVLSKVRFQGFIFTFLRLWNFVWSWFIYYRTLESLLKKNPTNSQEALVYLRDLAEGLDYVHKSGYLHRDLGKKNIFIGKDRNIKIGDFGLGNFLIQNANYLYIFILSFVFWYDIILPSPISLDLC